MVCASVVAVVSLLKRGKAREASAAAAATQANAAEMSGDQDHKPYIPYQGASETTTRETSFVSELPAPGTWQELSELTADYHQQHQSRLSRT